MTDHPARPGAVHVLEVGGGHVTGAAVAIAGGVAVVEHRRDRPLDSGGDAESILDTMCSVVPASPGEDAPVMVAMPGPFDYAQGSGTFAGVGKFGALAGLDLRAALAQRLVRAPSAVRFCNDAGAYGVGEWATGAGERAPRMLCITLGTGVGSAFLDHGVYVDAGDEVPLRGEIHTVRHRGAPLEDTVSTAAIRAAYARGAAARSPGAPAADSATADLATGAAAAPSVREIFARAREGETAAAEVVSRAMEELGRALGPWIRSFGAGVTVIGGAMAGSWDLIEAPLAAGVAASGGATALRAGRLGDEAPLIGAAVWASR